MNNFDTIIIGSGLGGLLSGALLSKEGQKVCLVEKEPFVGGCLRSFHRKGQFFDTGMHYIGSMDEGETLNHLFRYLGIYNELDLVRLDEMGFDRICLEGQTYGYAHGYENFTAQLCEAFPKEAHQLEAYLRKIHAVGQRIGVEQFKQGRWSEGNQDYLARAADEQLNASISDSRLRNVLSGNALLYDGRKHHTPFYTHAIIHDSMIRGAVRFRGGSQQLADLLGGLILRQGGLIRLNARVVEVEHQDNMVRGVRLESNERITAKNIISDIDPRALFRLIHDASALRKSYLSRIERKKYSHGIFTVYACVDAQAFPYRNYNSYLLTDGKTWADSSSIPDTVFFSMQAQKTNTNQEVVTLLARTPYREWEAWANTTVENRGEQYREAKRRKAEHLIDLTEQYFHGFRPAIQSIYTASPLSYMNYTACGEGAAYGMMPDADNILTTLLSPMTKLHGLYLTGQHIALHGALGVAMTALSTVGCLVGETYLAKKIGNF